MKTTERFESAVKKLYNAFHENRLNAMDPCACAVGNLCNNDNGWLIGSFGNRKMCEMYEDITKYSKKELSNIETLFMYLCIDPYNNLRVYQEKQEVLLNSGNDKERQFLGLCAVVEYLCELDNIPNPMDYSALFETENDKPKIDLSEVFI